MLFRLQYSQNKTRTYRWFFKNCSILSTDMFTTSSFDCTNRLVIVSCNEQTYNRTVTKLKNTLPAMFWRHLLEARLFRFAWRKVVLLSHPLFPVYQTSEYNLLRKSNVSIRTNIIFVTGKNIPNRPRRQVGGARFHSLPGWNKTRVDLGLPRITIGDVVFFNTGIINF